jgi:hypothetical protein
MCNGDDSASLEDCLDGILYLLLCLDVYIGRGLIDEDNLTLLEHSPGYTNQLLLSRTEVITSFSDIHIQALRPRLQEPREAAIIKDLEDVFI